MATSDNRIPANQVVWLLVGLVVIWVAWLFVPKSEKPRATNPPMVIESKLRAVGLRDNPDWDGLPEFFTVWADHAGWKDDKAQFAYWNPGSRSYSYFFEAARSKGKIRFRSLSKTELSVEASVFDEKTSEWEREGRPTQFESPDHPFVFFVPRPSSAWHTELFPVRHPPLDEPRSKVDVKLETGSLFQPPIDQPLDPNAGSKK